MAKYPSDWCWLCQQREVFQSEGSEDWLQPSCDTVLTSCLNEVTNASQRVVLAAPAAGARFRGVVQVQWSEDRR